MESNLKTTIESILSQHEGWIALSLYPPINETTIQKEGNRMYFNEGRGGFWVNVSEEFYDEMVEKYDSQFKNSKN